MKIRIKGNSIRFRLTKSDVNKLAELGYLEEKTIFQNGQFIYALESNKESNVLSTSLNNNKITIQIPKSFVKHWPMNDVISINGSMQINENDSIFLLVEKDFVCLDETFEDQSDNFDNPNKTC